MSDRAAAPVVGAVVLVAVTAVAAAVVGGLLAVEAPDDPTNVALEAGAAPSGEIRVTHRGGARLDPAALRVRVRVDGEPLAEQPPVPFFSAPGFESGPTGPFNSAYSGSWTAGETATLRLASTNEPTLRAGATVEIRIYADGQKIASLETTV